MMGDPLARATNKLISAVKVVNEQLNEKKRIILEAQQTIDETQVAINEAKKSLLM